MKKHEPLTGRVFNSWTVVSLIASQRNRMAIWLCRCVCGAAREVFQKHLLSGQSKSCGCQQPRRSNKKNWTGHEEISGEYWTEIQKCANGIQGRRTPVSFEITIQYAWKLYLKQDRKCALSGVPIQFDYRTRRTASLDRIDSSKGYVRGNVQWVHKDVNRMKNVFTQAYFLRMCKLIAERNKGYSDLSVV